MVKNNKTKMTKKITSKSGVANSSKKAPPVTSVQKISPFIWFDTQAEEAVNFYVSLFKNSGIGKAARYGDEGAKVSGRPKGSVMVIDFKLQGQKFSALNGGPIFKLNPSVSFFVYCKTEKEVDALFGKLSTGGQIMMPLAKYPFSERYAFLKDRYGVSWQMMLAPERKGIVPCLLFVGKSLGKAESAVNLYAKVFKKGRINQISHYGKGEHGKEGTIKHCSFQIEGQEFVAMDGSGPHQFGFNESISFVVNRKDQKEVDYYWNALSSGGMESQCGWLKDKFGVSWQITPSIMGELMGGIDPIKSGRAMAAMIKMRKLDIATLRRAYEG